MLFRKWFALALAAFWLTLWTHFLGADAGKKFKHHNIGQDYSEESSEWDWKVGCDQWYVHVQNIRRESGNAEGPRAWVRGHRTTTNMIYICR